MNSLGDGFVHLSKRRFILEDRITHPKGRFFLPREKIADNFTSSREKAEEGHVLPVRPVFLGSGPNSPRYIMMSPKYKFTSLKDMVGNKPVFSKERVVEMERLVSCIILWFLLVKGSMWFNIKNSPKGFLGLKK